MPLILYFYGSIGDCLKLVSFDTCYERYLPMRSSLGIWLEFCDKRAELVELEPLLSPCFLLLYYITRCLGPSYFCVACAFLLEPSPCHLSLVHLTILIAVDFGGASCYFIYVLLIQ